jgi:propionyl-CoA synthetase
VSASYIETYRRALERPDDFWAEAAEAIDWERRSDRVLDDSRPPFYRWFSGAKLNTCWNALDRHIAAAHGDRTALIWDSPVTGQIVQFTYRELRDAVARLAGAVVGLGVVKGDGVLIYMPMVPEAAMAMLACARIGAIHSVVFGGFAGTSSPLALTTPSRGLSCQPRAASRLTGLFPTSRCSTTQSPKHGRNPNTA